MKEKSIFANALIGSKPIKKIDKPKVNELLDIFRNSTNKKALEIERTKSDIKEAEGISSINMHHSIENKNANNIDSIIKRFSSDVPVASEKPTTEPEQKENTETSDLRKLIQSSEAKNVQAEKEEGEEEGMQIEMERDSEEKDRDRKDKKHDKHRSHHKHGNLFLQEK